MPKKIPDTTALKIEGMVPAEALKKLPLLDPSLKKDTQAKHLQLMAIRIDPPEIRLVWQIFVPMSAYRIEALDSAVHSFYKIENEKQFLKELAEISSLTRKEVNALLPLSVHPTLEKEEMNGKYSQALLGLVKKYASEKNIFKFTFMALAIPETRWDFGGMMIDQGRPAPLSIPKVNTSGIQIFVNNSFHEFSGGFGPYPKTGQDAFNRLVADSYKDQVKEPENMSKAHLTTRIIENPRLENSITVDCVSCHLAQTARTWLENTSPSLVRETENRFTSKKYILLNKTTDPGRTDNVHAFSYFLDMATINQRTINETAFVLERLNLSK